MSIMQSIDWNKVWQQARNKTKTKYCDNKFWNGRAPSFAANTGKSRYAENLIDSLNPQPDWSVLDVGCGPGTLALPLAPLVQQVTAIDFSEKMIALLNEQSIAQGLNNIKTRVLAWEDDWDRAEIGQHDVVIASRSLIVEDLEGALKKLNKAARQQVCIISLVGDGPFERRIFEALGRKLDRGPDYIYVYNLLHQMGVFAEVYFVTNDSVRKIYQDIDHAAEDFSWMLGEQSLDEQKKLRKYLQDHLVKTHGGWQLAYSHPVRWAVISWHKDAA